jgi:hypothetical protein
VAGTGGAKRWASRRLAGLLERLERLPSWPRRGSRRSRLIVLAVWLLAVGGGAVLIAHLVWRDELPRSTIALGALVLVGLMILWLFGPSGWRIALTVLSAVAGLLVTAGTALDINGRLPDGPAPPGALVDCPGYPGGHHLSGYVADTQIGYTLVRRRPNLRAHVLEKYPPGCHLAFEGYCIGEPKSHWRFPERDPVWFRLAGREGYVPSADIRAGAKYAGRLSQHDCPGRWPAPRRPEITAPLERRLTGPVEIAAADPEAIEVGFAVYYPEIVGRPGSASWHQIGVDLDTSDGITATWDSRSVPGQSDRRPAPITLMAVPCLGLDFPAHDDARRNYVVANGGGPTPPTNPPPKAKLADARRIACANFAR